MRLIVSNRSMSEVQEVIGALHNCKTPSESISFYDTLAPNYEEHTKVLQYTAPELAAQCLASTIMTDHDTKRILDVGCGTGLVAEELVKRGFQFFHGIDGSESMLQLARQKNIYQDLKKCILGQDPLPTPAELYDVLMIVGALSEGQVPYSVIPDLCTLLKPGGLVCVTVRCNTSNLQYKSTLDRSLRDLERNKTWEHVNALSVGNWEKATSPEEATPGSEFISGVVYIFRKL